MCLFDPHNYMKDASTGTKFPISFDRQYISSHTNTILSTNLIDDDIIHSRFAHASARRLDKLATRCIGFPKPSHIRTRIDPSSCDACNAGAARRRPFNSNTNPHKYTYFGACLSSDLCCPFPKSLDGYLYILNVVDACTNLLQVYFLRSKSSNEVKVCLATFLHEFKSQLPTNPTQPIRWHTDNGGEFISNDLDEFCTEFAIHRSFSTPYALSLIHI